MTYQNDEQKEENFKFIIKFLIKRLLILSIISRKLICYVFAFLGREGIRKSDWVFSLSY